MRNLPSLGPRGEGWVALQFVLLALVAASGLLLGPDWGEPARSVGLVAGAVLIVGGVILGARGLLDLGGALTPFPHPRADTSLVETGIYASARHPIYGGLIVASIGWSLVMASTASLVLSAVLAGFFLLKSAREEVWLEAYYPGYAAYRTRTHRFMPWIG